MKINIIGPSGSGKTTLAKSLSDKLDIPIYNLDYIIYKVVKDGKRYKRIEPSEEEYKKEVRSILKQKNWVIEGKYIIEDVGEQTT